jgi:hypothetical protein
MSMVKRLALKNKIAAKPNDVNRKSTGGTVEKAPILYFHPA